ncbi:MAG: enoyl-CoA hydratase-related protein [Bacillota bacterium]|jgi:enoyl-CoA hydratase|nr:crotonase [Candidatus Fermentithermobacillaceae bacterium]
MERFGRLQTLTVAHEDYATVITVARQESLNALNRKVLAELETVLDALIAGGPGKPLIITGEGPRAFVAGADIGEMANMTPDEAEEFARYGQGIFSKLEAFPGVTIAAVNGYALGGGNELAMACDIRIAASNARFGQPEVGLGIIPGFGGTQRLARIVGMANALDLVLTGRMIDAQEAWRIGLVHKVVDQGKALEESLNYAKTVMKNSPFAVAQAKKAIYGDPRRYSGMALEVDLFSKCFDHPDQKEGMKAFLEKRQAGFQKQG